MTTPCEDLKAQGMNRRARFAAMNHKGSSKECDGCPEKVVCASQTKNRSSAFKLNKMGTKRH
jgi:hypothetical protein